MEKMKEALSAILPEFVTANVDASTILIVSAVSLLVCMLASCRLFAKAGYHPALGLSLLVPVVNVMAFLYLAFAYWPMERELRSLRNVEKAVRRADSKHIRKVA
jgi:hypothetical protein